MSKTSIMSKSTVKDIIHKYLNIFEKISSTVVQKIPPISALDDIGAKFANKTHSAVFNKAVGKIDGYHIKIKCPPNQKDQYINWKMNYSIQMQAACDPNFTIINMCVGNPGSVHDQRVLINSSLYKNAPIPPEGYFLLGDAGYKCMMNLITILTPYKGLNLTERQTQFNHAHSKARITIEQTFGMLKTRWRAIFFKTLELDAKRCVQVVSACCVMHNICVSADDIIELENIELNNEYEPRSSRDYSDAVQFRDNLCMCSLLNDGCPKIN